MSLWLQAAIEALESGKYEHLRVDLMPHAPIPIPGCMLRELEFAERRCRDISKDQLFPIRFIWLMEAKELSMFGLDPMVRSLYNPEKLLAYWKLIITEPQYRHELEPTGVQFDLNEKALKLEAGWIYIGDQFVEDFLEIDTVAGVEILFPDPPESAGQPAFQEFKKHRSGGVKSASAE
jgi:hypothetical protein